jgi:hypothetical protein
VLVVPGARVTEASTARAALGVDAEGFLVYLERGEDDRRSLHALSGLAGLVSAIALPEGARLVLVTDDGRRTVDGRVAPTGSGIAFILRGAAYTDVLFPDVAPQPYRVWHRIQDTRVRYIPEPGPRRFGRPAGN